MRDDSPQTIHLKDYRAPAYWVDDVHLTFVLSPNATRVRARIAFRPNPDAPGPFALNGTHMKLLSTKIDGAEVTPDVTDHGLSCEVPNAAFIWEAEVEIDPASNTALEGLYMSNGMYCTQCEAEGFRRITYYPDRPDVMAPFTVRIEGDAPVLLSNGNPGATGPGWAEWHDPWPKPAYLFALVAGDLHAHSGQFTTMSGKDVALNIYVRDGDQDKCDFAMTALKASMRWDEDVYGRECDLDLFNIVAVDDFNMGAMENKGLNIFNSAAVLANPQTATDANFERIEAIIAHEYFHNWTGNRITCRDWFQLCLKEGLTVFRDQQFSADVRSAPVRRIEDVQMLRSRQFREDIGPLAHPVRPESFVEINNFYTATVYEKGAELIGMLKTLGGDAAYDAALALYFDRHDGQACTIEDWIQVFEDSTGRDLSQFKLWYSQAGTPHVNVAEAFADGNYTLTLSQHTPATPGQTDKAPLSMPVALGLLDKNGADLIGTQVLEFNQAQQSFSFPGLAEKPILSIFRGFSAPVIVDKESDPAERLFLMAHDSDPFNRWEAGRSLGRDVVIDAVTTGADVPANYLDALRKTALDADLDPAFRALCLEAPSQDDVAQTLFAQGQTPDPDVIYGAIKSLRHHLAAHIGDDLAALYDAHQVGGPYQPDAAGCGHRALANTALNLIKSQDGGALAQAQFDAADNMTQQLAALGALVAVDAADTALDHFYRHWAHERLVIDKWFGVQLGRVAPEQALARARLLKNHPDFTYENPNRFRALIGAFAGNLPAFHAADGAGYDFVAGELCHLDQINPQLAARVVTVFETWRRHDASRQSHAQAALTRIKQTKGLSRNTQEMVDRILS